MLKKILLVSGLVIFLMAFSVPEKVMKKAEKVIEKQLQTDDFTTEFISIPEAINKQTASHFGDDNFFRIKIGNTTTGYGYIGNAPSKTATFDYLVLFDSNFIITKSSVLIYREEYGGEIGSKRWLNQFLGKSYQTPELKYREDIIPISGATISVRSMTRAMNDLLQSLGTLQDLNAL
ncbi:FMN-binding protein [Pukyongia salina]|uniref:FMN-binding protein n=1 Tax=Pukyongia salina TaxID=2094025 RepID=A0A2S0HXT8_9FLAO|nr:FMN-binding protein [Pukyongia salina]AVI51479.1 FMN-binding protein [Pukyongia salina]